MVNPGKSVIDFTTALARLLRDGALRDACRENRAALADAWNMDGEERSAMLALDPDDLETQAVVLMRKRFPQITQLLPRTCGALDAEARPLFLAYARMHWPEQTAMDLRDARDFCRYVAEHRPEALCAGERNRLEFLFGQRRIAFHFPGILTARKRRRRILQILVRKRNGVWRDYAIYTGLQRMR